MVKIRAIESSGVGKAEFTLPYASQNATIETMIERLTTFYAFHIGMFLTLHRRAGIPRHSEAPSTSILGEGVRRD